MFGFFNNDKKIKGLWEKLHLTTDYVVQVLTQHNDWIAKLEEKFSYVEKRVDQYADIVKEHDTRLAKIESLLNEPSVSNQEIVEKMTTTKAVLKVLTKQSSELSINSIFDMIKRYNLKNTNVTRNSLRALLYRLRREGRVDYGEEQGTFKGVPGIYG